MRLAAYNVENLFERAKALNLPTWRLRDQLEVLDGGDLAFDAGQVVQLGRKLMDEPLSRAQAERLTEAHRAGRPG